MPQTDLDVARSAANAAALVVRQAFTETGETSQLKGAVNPVTEIDARAEEEALGVIARQRPDDAILAEESGGEGWEEGRVWLVDPLDGTINFLHRVPQVAVSVGMWENGVPRVGVVIDVLREETFAARAGGGATLNRQPIRVSEVSDPAGALIATGFPYDRQDHAEAYTRVLAGVLTRFQGIRRIGSAALDLCWVACGRFDGFWEYGLGPWDAAAAMLIAAEAGATVTRPDGSGYRLDDVGIVAANPAIHPLLRETVWERHPAHL